MIEGAAETGSLVRLYQNGTQIAAVTATNGAWSFTYPTSLTAGTYDLTATATDTIGNVSTASNNLTLNVAADNSYALVMPVPGTDTTKSFVYDSTGTLSTVETRASEGRVLTSVNSTTALINIYNSDGTLIGTITQPIVVSPANLRHHP